MLSRLVLDPGYEKREKSQPQENTGQRAVSRGLAQSTVQTMFGSRTLESKVSCSGHHHHIPRLSLESGINEESLFNEGLNEFPF